MKHLHLLFMLLFALAFTSVKAQVANKQPLQHTKAEVIEKKIGHITSEGFVQIEKVNDLGGYYSIDTQSLGFQSLEEATAYFRNKSGKHHMMRAIAPDAAIIYIKHQEQPAWDTKKWNLYLARNARMNTLESSPTKDNGLTK